MDSYTRLLNVLKSDSFKNYIYTNFDEYIDRLNQDLKNPDIFMKYCRAFVVDIYLSLDDDMKNKLVNQIERNGLTDTEMDFLIFNLNACVSKPNDHIDKESEEFFEELEPYKDKPLSKLLTQYRKEIFEVLSREMGVFTINQIKDGDYYIPQKDSEGRMSEYILDDNEIETIENAHKASLLVDIGHSLYDDIKYTQRPSILGGVVIDKYITCDYEKADNDGLGNIVFDTLKDGPKLEIDIVFEDGIIMQYHKGAIRKKQYTNDEMMTYIYADITRMLEEDGYDENNISTIDPDDLESTITFACMEITAQSDYLGKIYSKKMIDSSKKYVKKLVRIAKEEKL